MNKIILYYPKVHKYPRIPYLFNETSSTFYNINADQDEWHISDNETEELNTHIKVMEFYE